MFYNRCVQRATNSGVPSSTRIPGARSLPISVRDMKPQVSPFPVRAAVEEQRPVEGIL